MDEIPVVTTDTLPNQEVLQVQTVPIVVSVEGTEEATVLKQAIAGLRAEAKEVGATAIVGFGLTVRSRTSFRIVMTAYGTPVRNRTF